MAIDDKGPSCKTARIRKTLNPTWDEQFVFEGIAEDTLPLAKLQMQVTHDVRSFNRCKKREVLGTLDLQQLSWLDMVNISSIHTTAIVDLVWYASTCSKAKKSFSSLRDSDVLL